MSKKNKVLVIGAGISGLAAAKNLNDSGYDVTILAVSYTHLTLPTILRV